MSYVTGRYIITHRTLGNLRSPRHTGNKSKKYNVGKPKKHPKNTATSRNKQKNNNPKTTNKIILLIIIIHV